jgi:hypothetical protein
VGVAYWCFDRSLTITQIFHELHDTDQGEAPGMDRWLPFDGIDRRKQFIGKERA